MNDLVEIVNGGGLAELAVGRYLYTGDVKDRKQRQALAMAVQGKPPSLADCINIDIEVVNLMYHRIAFVNKDSGEIKRLGRLCLFCKDGKVYATCGEKAVRDALMPAMLFGFPLPYNPPQRFHVSKVKTRSDGGGYISLDWIDGGSK